MAAEDISPWDYHCKINKSLPVMNVSIPTNEILRGYYARSFAYKSLVERLPIILTKAIDALSRGGGSGTVGDVAKLKNELVTNKRMTFLTLDTEDAEKWNKYIHDAGTPYYFTAPWVFAECYVYRRLQEAIELNNFEIDPFQRQKEENFQQNLEAMCIVSDKVFESANNTEAPRDQRKQDLILLLKLCLWANKCDSSLSVGNTTEAIVSPITMVTKLKPNLLADDTGKLADFICDKSAALAKNLDGEYTEEQIEHARHCPSRINQAYDVIVDIVCDNAGYELFTDLCLAHFIVSRTAVKKIRFHVKSFPWFVSDVTPNDFNWVIHSTASASFDKEIPAPLPTKPGEVQGPPSIVSANSMRALGEAFKQHVQNGVFIVETDHYWTSPNCYKDMKRLDPVLYRKLQHAVCCIYKGDLNYRKLIGEKRWSPTTSFETSLQGFMPTATAAIRTVKSECVVALPKGKNEAITKLDQYWMEKGNYGVIHFLAKREQLKTVAEKPCVDYGDKCLGKICN